MYSFTFRNTEIMLQSHHGTVSLLDVQKVYLTQSVDTDIRTVLRAERPILNFAGQGEEEIIAFGKAVQLAHILIWKERKQPPGPNVYCHDMTSW